MWKEGKRYRAKQRKSSCGDLFRLRYLQVEQEDFAPKTETFFTTFLPPHDRQDTLIEAPLISRSNSLLQRAQANSKMGTGPPSRSYALAGGIDRASARNFSMPTSVSGWRTICSSTENGTVAM